MGINNVSCQNKGKFHIYSWKLEIVSLPMKQMADMLTASYKKIQVPQAKGSSSIM